MSALYVDISRYGKGVFAKKKISRGERICRFYGPLLHLNDLPKERHGEADRYVQIGKDLYFGPTGDFDDYINHSCDPNCGLVIKGTKAYAIAVRDIAIGEELTWDYSTTLDEDAWEMECACGSLLCRRLVRGFKYLPENTKQKYLKLGIVPEYNILYCSAKTLKRYAYHEVRPLVPAR